MSADRPAGDAAASAAGPGLDAAASAAGGPGRHAAASDGVPLVTTVGPLDPVVALLRELLHAAAAIRATAVVPGADGAPPAVVDAARLLPVEVARGDDVVQLPHGVALDALTPALPDFRPLPPFEADPVTGEIAAPLGGVEHRGRATAAAAALLPAGSVLQLAWESMRPDVPFSVTARSSADEPLVLGVGEEAFPMPADWPDGPAT